MKKDTINVVKSVCLVTVTFALSWLMAFLYDEYLFSVTVFRVIVFATPAVSSVGYYFIARKANESRAVVVSTVTASTALILITDIIINGRCSILWGITDAEHYFSQRVPFFCFMVAVSVDMLIFIIRTVKSRREEATDRPPERDT